MGWKAQSHNFRWPCTGAHVNLAAALASFSTHSTSPPTEEQYLRYPTEYFVLRTKNLTILISQSHIHSECYKS